MFAFLFSLDALDVAQRIDRLDAVQSLGSTAP